MFPNRWGIKPRIGSFWVGAHWSPYNKRLCVNIIPCFTVWLVWPGGLGPDDAAHLAASYMAGSVKRVSRAEGLAAIKGAIP